VRGLRRPPALTALGLLAAVALPVLGGPPGPAVASPSRASRPAGLAVTGWVLDSGSDRLVARNAAGVTTLSVAGVSISADGRRVADPNRGARRLLRAAHRHRLAAELLVSNYSNRLGDFDPRAAHLLLASRDRTAAVSARLAGIVRRQGWDGVNVDLERVRRADAAGLVALVGALQDRMPAARTVSVDVGASTSVRGYRAGGYALADLASGADGLDLMTYDQHGPGWSGPGPIGALAWQRDALEALLSVVPARQVRLGVAGYGYAWRPGGGGRDLTVRQARRLVDRAGATAHWRSGAGEWTARLPDGTVLWWSDRRSYRLRVGLARRYAVDGLAVWRLGSADPLR
jgi:spore germination protein YaaH